MPSRQRPLIVASWDRAVLRYLADTVLSVPPGTGQVLSMVLTVGPTGSGKTSTLYAVSIR